jgi:peptidoglycan/xylan/chitin deacetylase (PgdA/CDA1 family)
LLPFLLLGSLTQAHAPVAGDTLARFTLTRESGGTYEFKPGRTTVLTVWAYWCDTWKTQDQRMAAAKKAAVGLPVDFLAVSIDGRWTDLAHPPTWGARLLDKGGEWSRAVKIDRVPYTMVVGPDGTVRWAKDGVVRSEDVLRAINGQAKGGGTVYLTFDDFPSGKSQDYELLDILRARDVHASFFCVGEKVKAHPKVGARAVADGNRLEVHGWEHDSNADPARCASLLQSLYHQAPHWVRLPGKSTITALSGKGKFAGKTINPYDYSRPGKAELLRRILNALGPGSMIQLHAGVDETVQILPELIDEAKKRHLKIGALGVE